MPGNYFEVIMNFRYLPIGRSISHASVTRRKSLVLEVSRNPSEKSEVSYVKNIQVICPTFGHLMTHKQTHVFNSTRPSMASEL